MQMLNLLAGCFFNQKDGLFFVFKVERPNQL
jgi:hypothetical protein